MYDLRSKKGTRSGNFLLSFSSSLSQCVVVARKTLCIRKPSFAYVCVCFAYKLCTIT